MESIWSQSCEIEQRAPLPGSRKTEVAVIGAGMAGLLIASALQEAGHSVLVLEAGRIASGQTRNTTAKITSQHGLIYDKLIGTVGADKAKQYALANQGAVEQYRQIIGRQNIHCDLEETWAYVYGNDLSVLRREAEAAAGLGLPASLVEETALPFPAAGAVRFEHQAQFHPLKFLRALAEPLTIFEQTPVLKVEDHTVVTDRGRVEAEKIVFACHYPFVNVPGLYFARMHQERSYVVALRNAGPMEGMWIGAEQGENNWSFRSYHDLLLLGGGGHRTGENSKGGQYERLRKQARSWFPNSQEVAHWSAQDCITPDNIPYIGQYCPTKPDWYVATGFHKWGMTSSMVSALILRDLIEGRENPWAEVFDPGRFDASTIPGIVSEGAHAVKGLVKRAFQIPAEQAAGIPAGHGGIVSLQGEKVGVYKDESGTLYPVDIKCPHLGCQLEWNPEERSWDCPCHGSRFDRFGNLISGPAQEGLNHG